MRILTMSGAFVFVLASAIGGCAVEPVESLNDNEEIGASEDAVKLSEINAVPAYFGVDNRFTPQGDAPWIYARFTTFKGIEINAEVGLAAGAPDGHSVGFKIYHVLPNEKLKLLETVDGPDGKASLSFISKGTGVYVIEMVTSAHLEDLVLRLGCDSDKCSPDPQPGGFCGGIAGIPCDEGLYCKYEPEAMCGAADQGGTCAIQPQACTKEYKPVCGCDGQTYGNACTAAASGVSIIHEGECSAPGGGAQEGEMCGGFAGIACDEGLYCAFPPEASCGAGDQSGVCAVMPGGCIQIYDPVCGCDGKTYGNACNAASAGVSVAHDGECAPIAQVGESCGGFLPGPSPVCADGLYCNYAIEDTCGWADAPGTCAEKPELCTKEYNPVCGCDGQTYGNACMAAASGAAVLHLGECQAF